MNVKFLDLKAQYAKIKNEVDAAVSSVISSQININEPDISTCISDGKGSCY